MTLWPRTQKFWISSLEPGSWPPNWLQGKARISKSLWLVRTSAGESVSCVASGRLRERICTLVESLEVVELRGEAALAGGVDDEDDLALQVGEVVGGTLVIFGLEVVEGGCGRHGACCCCCGEEEGGGGRSWFGRGQVTKKRGCQSGLAEAWCYEHGGSRDGVITQTRDFDGRRKRRRLARNYCTKRVRLPAIGVCAEACDLFDGCRWLLAGCLRHYALNVGHRRPASYASVHSIHPTFLLGICITSTHLGRPLIRERR